MKSDILLHCPYCQHAPKIRSCGDYKQFYYYECECGNIGAWNAHRSIRIARLAWNFHVRNEKRKKVTDYAVVYSFCYYCMLLLVCIYCISAI